MARSPASTAEAAIVCGALGVIPLAAVAIAVDVAAGTFGVMGEGLLLGYGFFVAVPGLGFTLAALALGCGSRRHCGKEAARVRTNALGWNHGGDARRRHLRRAHHAG